MFSASAWLDAAMLAATTVWSCVVYGGQLLVAIDAVRGTPVNWRRFRQGVRYTWRLTACILPLLPLLVLTYLPETAWLETAAVPLLAAAVVTTVVAFSRTILWAPLIVDSNISAVRAFASSWKATRGSLRTRADLKRATAV